MAPNQTHLTLGFRTLNDLISAGDDVDDDILESKRDLLAEGQSAAFAE